MNGVLVVDKPAGPSSHDVVAVARRALGTSRIGHTGTLDPLASGVLPLVVGRATRLAQFLSASEKEYVADVRTGTTTPTYDAEARLVSDPATGKPVLLMPPATVPACATRETVDGILEEFRGTYWQVPPPFSAKKVAGMRAHRLARAGKPAELKPVEVTVRELALLSCEQGLISLRIVCSSGFYVRTLAHDIGERLQCGAYLERLRRTRAGDFTLEDAVSLEQLQTHRGEALSRIVPIDRLLPHLPAVVLRESGVRRACHGNALSPEDIDADALGDRVRLMDPAGTLLGVAERLPGGLLHPSIVLV